MTDHTGPDLTYDLSLLRKSEQKWNKSAGLRHVYGDFYQEIRNRMLPGPSLELGSGIGKSREFLPGIVTSDLTQTSYVDRVCSAYEICLPSTGQWSNIIAVDVLHHLCRPMDFFASATKALAPGGRIILLEPAATFFGKAFYKTFHAEPIKPDRIKPPFEFPPDLRDGTFANMGMAFSLFCIHKKETTKLLNARQMRITETVFRDILAYPMTGGYSGLQLAPQFVLKSLLALERLLPQLLLRRLGIRMLVMIEKDP